MRIDHPPDPGRGLLDREAERAGDLLVDCGEGCSAVGAHSASEEIVGRDDAERYVGVGDGDLSATASVADRSGIGTGAVRTDGHQTVLDPRDGAAASADRANVDHWGVEVIASGFVGSG